MAALNGEAGRPVIGYTIELQDPMLLEVEPSLRAPAETLAANELGQPGLWPHSISGDLPILLVRVVGDLFDQRLNPYFAKLAHYFENPESWRAALAEHRAIRDSIAARDSDAARTTMRQHLARSQERFAQSFGTEAASSARMQAGSG